MPPGKLPQLWKEPDQLPEHYVILGAGKTAMDTAIWLIEGGVSPQRIHWVRPRESWLWNREYTQPGEGFIERIFQFQIALLRYSQEAKTGDDLMELMGQDSFFLRIDTSSRPEMFHFATIAHNEIDILRRIENVIRKGRVTAIEPCRLHFGNDTALLPENSLYIDCTASAVPFSVREGGVKPIFRGDRIVLQPLQTPLVTFSAAMTAFIEANFDDENTRNQLAAPGPLTDTPGTFPYAQMINLMNRGSWSQQPSIMEWLAKSRLDVPTGAIAELMKQNSPKLALLDEMRGAVQEHMPALIRLGMQAKAIHEAT